MHSQMEEAKLRLSAALETKGEKEVRTSLKAAERAGLFSTQK